MGGRKEGKKKGERKRDKERKRERDRERKNRPVTVAYACNLSTLGEAEAGKL